ncbi:MAG: hypothetical protein ACFB21_00395 [Opitutales bacterium]
MNAHAAQQWRHRARLTAAVANLLWVLHYFLPAFVGLNAVMALAWLLARQSEWPDGAVWLGYLGGTAVLLGVAAWLARRHYLSSSDGLQRLEEHLGLRSALSAAEEGVVDWPSADVHMSLPYRFQSRRVWPPLAASCALLLAGWLIPVSSAKPSPDIQNAEQPLAWEKVEAVIEALEDESIVAEQSVDDLRNQLAALRGQPEAQWFNQSSLEAGENLRDQTMLELREAARNLQMATASLEAMRELGPQATPMQAEMLEQQFSEAMQNLQMSELQLDAEMLAELAELGNCEACMRLSPEDWEKLRAKLGECNGELCAIAGLDPEELAKIRAMCRGGIGRGPGEAPLFFEDESHLSPARREAVSNQEMDNAALGEMVGLRDREAPPEDEMPAYKLGVGQAAPQGQGGDVVWKNQLTPQERELLERYYE